MKRHRFIWLTVGVAVVVIALASTLVIHRPSHQMDTARGYIDKTGKIVIEPQFDVTTVFSEGLAAVGNWGRDREHPEHQHKVITYGYIDKSGQYVIPPKLNGGEGWGEPFGFADSPYSFKNGVATVWGTKPYTIDRTGRIVSEAARQKTTETAPNFRKETLSIRQEDGKCGYVNGDGRVVIDYRFDIATKFSEGLAAVCVGAVTTPPNRFPNGKWGYIDESGKFSIPPTYDMAYEFHDGLASVSLNGKSGYIDKRCNLVIPLRFAYGAPFSEGLAWVEVKGHYDWRGHFHWR